MNFKEFWNKNYLDRYRTTEDYCFASWNGGMTEMKSKVIDILKKSFKKNNCSTYMSGEELYFRQRIAEILNELKDL